MLVFLHVELHSWNHHAPCFKAGAPNSQAINLRKNSRLRSARLSAIETSNTTSLHAKLDPSKQFSVWLAMSVPSLELLSNSLCMPLLYLDFNLTRWSSELVIQVVGDIGQLLSHSSNRTCFSMMFMAHGSSFRILYDICQPILGETCLPGLSTKAAEKFEQQSAPKWDKELLQLYFLASNHLWKYHKTPDKPSWDEQTTSLLTGKSWPNDSMWQLYQTIVDKNSNGKNIEINKQRWSKIQQLWWKTHLRWPVWTMLHRTTRFLYLQWFIGFDFRGMLISKHAKFISNTLETPINTLSLWSFQATQPLLDSCFLVSFDMSYLPPILFWFGGFSFSFVAPSVNIRMHGSSVQLTGEDMRGILYACISISCLHIIGSPFIVINTFNWHINITIQYKSISHNNVTLNMPSDQLSCLNSESPATNVLVMFCAPNLPAVIGPWNHQPAWHLFKSSRCLT